MGDNCIVVKLRCQEIADRALISIVVNLDKVSDANNVWIEISREDLTQLGEVATWEVSDE